MSRARRRLSSLGDCTLHGLGPEAGLSSDRANLVVGEGLEFLRPLDLSRPFEYPIRFG